MTKKADISLPVTGFNSAYNRDSFLAAIPGFLKKFPDYRRIVPEGFEHAFTFDRKELAAAIKAGSPKVVLETYDLTMDRDKSQEYGVKRVPAFVVQGQGVRSVTFSGSVEDIALMLLLDAIVGVAEGRVWFPSQVLGPLGMIQREVAVQVLIENDCNLCRPVAETAIGLALSSRFVSAEIIMADQFPELLAKHRIKVLPYTIFRPKLHLVGHVTESMFLEMLFHAEGKGGEPDRRCAVCGTPSPDVICSN